MSEPYLSVLSARARELAHRLARRRRPIAEIVARMLKANEAVQAAPASPNFSQRLL